MKAVTILLLAVILWPVALAALWTGSVWPLVPPVGLMAIAVMWAQVKKLSASSGEERVGTYSPRARAGFFSRVDSAAEAGSKVVVFPHGSRSQSLIGRRPPISPREIELAEEAADDYVFHYKEFADKEPPMFRTKEGI